MTENRQRPKTTVAVGGETGGFPAVVSDSSPTESELARRRLRQRWELASVLNFLHVFDPVVGIKTKISAEEIETALITPNTLLAQLHVALLKGIPPVSKSLNVSDAWVTVLCKKLAMWWPWVAEGDIPLIATKGEEISKYKELDPIIRLLLLKALCEIRADQDDAVSYINDGLKKGTEPSSFRKDKIGGDGNGTTYWYDGNAVIGHRLYKEVSKFESKPKVKDKGSIPTIISEWETLATNLDEFHKVMDEFLSSEAKLEVAVAKTIETDAIPVLEKLHKKKEKTLKQQQRREMLLNGFCNYGTTRSCRNRRPVSYTFDEYDRAIEEAIQVTKKRKTTKKKEPRQEEKRSEREEKNKNASNGSSDTETDSRSSSIDTHDSMASDTESDKLHGDQDDVDYDSKKDGGDNEDDNYSSSSDMENNELGNKNHATQSHKRTDSFVHKHFGSRWSTRLVGTANHSISETKTLGAKNRSRQRPTRNSALESVIVSDSEDGQSSDNKSNGVSGGENSSSAHLDDDSDSLNASSEQD